jgi:hypothetical protein
MPLKIEYMTLTPTDATNRYVTLAYVPTDGTVALDVITGTSQAQITDFTVDSTKVKWTGLNLDPTISPFSGLKTSDELRIIYDRS